MCVYDLSRTWVLQVPNCFSHAGAYENRPAVACAGWHPESLAGEHASLGRVQVSEPLMGTMDTPFIDPSARGVRANKQERGTYAHRRTRRLRARSKNLSTRR